MNKFSKYIAGAIILAPLALTSCSDDDNNSRTVITDLSQLSYNENGVWAGWNVDDDLETQGFEFSHDYTDYGGGAGMSSGFVAAKQTDNEFHNPMYDYQFTVMPQGGKDGFGTPYMVAYWSSYDEMGDIDYDDRTCHITYTGGGDTPMVFSPIGMYVTNNCYAYYSMSQGDAYAKKFGDGDWFKLTAHGVRADGTETTADFYLADFRETGSKGIVSDWQYFDLTGLGNVLLIYFTMDSSDSGAWGMNTPAYFAIDKFTAKYETL